MRSLFVGLVATALAVFAVGDPVLAFQAKAAKAPKVDPVVEAQTLAPVVIQGAKLPCTLADVRNDRSSDKQVVLELACKEGIGFIVVSAKDGSNAQAQECVDTRQKIDVVCSLPGNVNPAKGLQPYVTRAGSDCVVDKANVLGTTPTKTIYEVGCTNGLGQMLSIDLPRGDTAKVVAAPCLAISALLCWSAVQTHVPAATTVPRAPATTPARPIHRASLALRWVCSDPAFISAIAITA